MAVDVPIVGGAYAVSPYGILPVFGQPILLNPLVHDIQEMARMTNANFRTGSAPAVLVLDDLPGPVTV